MGTSNLDTRVKQVALSAVDGMHHFAHELMESTDSEALAKELALQMVLRSRQGKVIDRPYYIFIVQKVIQLSSRRWSFPTSCCALRSTGHALEITTACRVRMGASNWLEISD